MIAPMIKYTFLVYHREYESFLQALRNAGVVHIIGRERGSEEEDESIRNLFRRRETCIQALKFLPKDIEEKKVAEETDPEKVVERIETIRKDLEENEQRLQELVKNIRTLEPWGDFTGEDLEKVRAAGYEISFYSCPVKRFQDEWAEKWSVQIIHRERGHLYFVVIHHPEETVELEADPVRLPKESLSSLVEERDRLKKENAGLHAEMKKNTGHWKAILNRYLKELENEIGMFRAKNSAGEQADGKLRILEGWVPAGKEEGLKTMLEDSGVYYIASPAGEDEEAPVELENNWFSRLFEPISKLFDLPKYRELDLTPFFAPFFVMFFGFCLGDAGYGLLFILAGFLLKKKVQPNLRPILTLGQFLGLGTVIFGALSGTFFGINLIDTGYTITASTLEMLKAEGLPAALIENLGSLMGEHFETRRNFLDAAIQAAGADAVQSHRMLLLKHTAADVSLLSSFRHLMQEPINMFYLSMILGAVQILFGMVVKIFNITKQKGFAYSLSTVGWVVLALTLLVFRGGEMAGWFTMNGLKYVYYALLGVAGVLIFLLNDPKKNPFMRIGSGIWETYNILTGVFGDLLSYIRLFALGISSAILGFVFNDMASQFLSTPWIGWLPFLLLLVFGHSINLFMAALGGFIHPMRLTFVEFYKNAGFRGGGKPYQPFALTKYNKQ
ncbi:MAG TPA: hypothetical protein ENN63_09360 [Bacteroidetes bacterium]|mgnify:CR=1 FL=1|nr:hypothetical protein [Bacteroidota bacterium]